MGALSWVEDGFDRAYLNRIKAMARVATVVIVTHRRSGMVPKVNLNGGKASVAWRGVKAFIFSGSVRTFSSAVWADCSSRNIGLSSYRWQHEGGKWGTILGNRPRGGILSQVNITGISRSSPNVAPARLQNTLPPTPSPCIGVSPVAIHDSRPKSLPSPFRTPSG